MHVEPQGLGLAAALGQRLAQRLRQVVPGGPALRRGADDPSDLLCAQRDPAGRGRLVAQGLQPAAFDAPGGGDGIDAFQRTCQPRGNVAADSPDELVRAGGAKVELPKGVRQRQCPLRNPRGPCDRS